MSHFPYIDTIDELLEAIKGRDEFIVKDDQENDLLIMNYLVNFEDTFPRIDIEDQKERRRRQLLRECRGIVFDRTTREIVSRPYHKFRNLNETDEYMAHRIDFTKPHVILDKLDGSFIRPIMRNEMIRYATKMGFTDVAGPAQQFANEHDAYAKLSGLMIYDGCTPIFEWCSRKQRIVIDYPVDDLVLTNVRYNNTGDYFSREDVVQLGKDYGISTVAAYEGTLANMEAFLKHTRELKGAEGYVIVFSDLFIKVKAEEYCELHKTLDQLRWEKDVLSMVLHDKADDARALLAPELGEKLDVYAKAVFQGMYASADKLYWVAQAAYDNVNGSKKRFALEVIPEQPQEWHSMLFRIFDQLDKGVEGAYEVVKNKVLDNVGTSTKVNSIRDLIGGVVWDDLKIDLDN